MIETFLVPIFNHTVILYTEEETFESINGLITEPKKCYTEDIIKGRIIEKEVFCIATKEGPVLLVPADKKKMSTTIGNILEASNIILKNSLRYEYFNIPQYSDMTNLLFRYLIDKTEAIMKFNTFG